MSQILNKMAKSAYTWNGALSYATTGFDQYGACLDYWTKAGTYTRRRQADVDSDMVRIFADDERIALAIVFGLRLITRQPDVEGIEDVQTGYGRKDEFYKAVIWLNQLLPNLLYRNLHLIPVFGCWKDLMTEPLIDVLERQQVYALVKENLGDSLLRKYLPQICSHKNLRTERDRKRVEWAKGLCRYLEISNAEYRKLKAEGAAHIWQKQMSRREFAEINFNGIPGKAMLWHTSRKGQDQLTVFERHGQVERLQEWVLQQKQIKFTGYPYELTKAASYTKHPSLVQRLIYNQQFATVLEPLKRHKLGNVLCAIDTSGSMQCEVIPGVSAYDICLSMGLVFSVLNLGHFRDVVVAFDDFSSLVRLSGEFVDRLHQLEQMTTAWGSTNFQSVIDLLVRIREENPDIPLEDYPETIVVISDMQFNPVGGNTQTNYEAAMEKLREVGLQALRIIWWYVNGQGTDFPAQMNDKGVYTISGFDPVNLQALMGLHIEQVERNQLITTENEKQSAGEQEETAINTNIKQTWAEVEAALWRKLAREKYGFYQFNYEREHRLNNKVAERNQQTAVKGMMNFLGQPIFGLLQFEP